MVDDTGYVCSLPCSAIRILDRSLSGVKFLPVDSDTLAVAYSSSIRTWKIRGARLLQSAMHNRAVCIAYAGEEQIDLFGKEMVKWNLVGDEMN